MIRARSEVLAAGAEELAIDEAAIGPEGAGQIRRPREDPEQGVALAEARVGKHDARAEGLLLAIGGVVARLRDELQFPWPLLEDEGVGEGLHAVRPCAEGRTGLAGVRLGFRPAGEGGAAQRQEVPQLAGIQEEGGFHPAETGAAEVHEIEPAQALSDPDSAQRPMPQQDGEPAGGHMRREQ